MSYASQQQFVDAFGEDEAIALSNPHDGLASAVNAVVLGRSLEDASAEIDSYLTGRYTLPLEQFPAVLVRCCNDVARYRLDTISPRDDVRRRYEDTIRYLEQLAKGVVSLGLDQSDAIVPQSVGMPETITSEKFFSDRAMQGF